MLNKIKYNLKLIRKISSVTNVYNKKIRIFYSVLFSNFIVLFDVLIIYFFSSFFTQTETQISILKYILEIKILFPLFIVLRYIFYVLDKLNLKHLQVKISENIKNYLLKDIFNKGNYSISDSNYYLTQLTDHISYFYGALATTLSSLLQLLLYLIFLSISDIYSLFYFLILGVLVYLPSIYFLKQGRKQMDSNFKFGLQINQDTQNVIQNLFLFKLLGTFEDEYKDFKQNTNKFSISSLKNYLFGIVNTLTPNLITTLVVSILLTFFNFFSKLTLEFVGIVLRLVQTLGNVNNGLNMIINSHVHLEKFSKILENKKNNSYKYEVNQNLINAVEFDNISFKYFGAENYIFKNLNLNFSKNTHNILLGPNGSGKSTILGLIAGVFEANLGSIYLDSKSIGYVGVNPLIVKGTLRKNLMYGNKETINDKDLINYCNKFQLYKESEMINLDQIVTNSTLSSGQFQKIAFIRALLSKIDILLLDESTSNLDDESRQLVFDLLLNEKITIINATHNAENFKYDNLFQLQVENRLSTIYKV